MPTEREMLEGSNADGYWNEIVKEVEASGRQVRHASLLNHQATHLLYWANLGRNAAIARIENEVATKVCCNIPENAVSCAGPTASPEKPLKLKWKYCECGCHGHGITVGGLYYWLFNDLKGKFKLYEGHEPYGNPLGVFSSFNGADYYLVGKVKESIEEMQRLIK